MLAGLDIGTTGSKIVIYDYQGKYIDKFYCSYETKRINNCAEIDPNELIFAVKKILKEANEKYEIDSIGVDSFGEAFVLLDKEDKPLFNILINSDNRGDEELKTLIDKLGEEKIEQITKIKPHQTFSLPKIMWLKSHETSTFNRCDKILLIEDFVIYTLTGNRYIDYSLACRSMAFDPEKLEFSNEILSAAGIDKKLFSTPVRVGFNCGNIQDSIKKELGIDREIAIATAGHDQIAVALGCGIDKPGLAVDGAGTFECITTVFDKKYDTNI